MRRSVGEDISFGSFLFVSFLFVYWFVPVLLVCILCVCCVCVIERHAGHDQSIRLAVQRGACRHARCVAARVLSGWPRKKRLGLDLDAHRRVHLHKVQPQPDPSPDPTLKFEILIDWIWIPFDRSGRGFAHWRRVDCPQRLNGPQLQATVRSRRRSSRPKAGTTPHPLLLRLPQITSEVNCLRCVDRTK